MSLIAEFVQYNDIFVNKNAGKRNFLHFYFCVQLLNILKSEYLCGWSELKEYDWLECLPSQCCS